MVDVLADQPVAILGRKRRQQRRQENLEAAITDYGLALYEPGDTQETLGVKVRAAIEEDWRSERPFLAALLDAFMQFLPRLFEMLFGLLGGLAIAPLVQAD